MKHQQRALRIIGGKWRGRKITFPDVGEIRPTGDRIRETLFNWLMHEIPGARCLDLYAGSGALGIESLSRGAAHVAFVEKDKDAAIRLGQTLDQLEATQYTIDCTAALDWLSGCDAPFDIVFLDPPFSGDELMAACAEIKNRFLARRFVYIETSKPELLTRLPDGWTVHREKTSGSVTYCLCTTN